jgi:hypothetical protein
MTMIGKPKRTFTVEPLEDPVPGARPAPQHQPEAPSKPPEAKPVAESTR